MALPTFYYINAIYHQRQMRKLTKEEFIKRAREVHGDKYDYSKVEYKNARVKVCIICPKHGEFWQNPSNHLNHHECPQCGIDIRNKKNSLSKEDFIAKSNKIHGYKYDYSKVEYINNTTKVCIICPIHGEFWQTPACHLCREGCPKCGTDIAKQKLSSNKDEFVLKSYKVHGHKYDYSHVEYTNSVTKVCIICPSHGIFWQRPSRHLSGDGCPLCKQSHGEKSICNFLEVNNIDYITQYRVELDTALFSRNHIKIDFYIPSKNTFIEFNGIQHYEKSPFFHKTEDDFRLQVERDERLKKYCKKNKINLIVIKYNQIDKINEILIKKLKLNNYGNNK